MSEPVLLVRARKLRAARGAEPWAARAAWLCLPGLALVAVAAFLVTRLA